MQGGQFSLHRGEAEGLALTLVYGYFGIVNIA